MRYRKLATDGDMTFGHQQADFYQDEPAAAAQAVLTRLQLWLGEWFLDQTDGMPFQQAVLGKHTQASIEPALRARILETPGVLSIDSFELLPDRETRHMTLLATVNTLYGTVSVVEVL